MIFALQIPSDSTGGSTALAPDGRRALGTGDVSGVPEVMPHGQSSLFPLKRSPCSDGLRDPFDFQWELVEQLTEAVSDSVSKPLLGPLTQARRESWKLLFMGCAGPGGPRWRSARRLHTRALSVSEAWSGLPAGVDLAAITRSVQPSRRSVRKSAHCARFSSALSHSLVE